MGSQLNMQAAYLNAEFASFTYPLIHAGAAPAYLESADPRPPKRLRLAAQALTTLDTKLPPNLHEHEIGSAQCIPREHAALQHVPPRSSSVPPEQPRRGRKKKTWPPPQSDPFILEHMPFPEHQPWLKVRPRQRKAAVEVVEEAPVLPPASTAPDEGEDLILDKHADRIAALIAQKRKENDSKHFRQRMALQQRLHRGEKDELDRVIAASHDELKRKMELSAQGIFEESPPEGMGLEFRMGETSAASSVEHTDLDVASSTRSVRQETVSSGDIPSTRNTDFTSDTELTEASENSDLEDDHEEFEAVIPIDASYGSPPPVPGPYVHYNSTAYYREAALVRTLAISATGPVSRVAENLHAQSAYSGQYSNNVQHWRTPQPWTTQMFHALPSTQTPELERAELAPGQQRIEHYEPFTQDNAVRGAYSQTLDGYDFFGSTPHSVTTTNTSSSSSTPAAGITHGSHQATLLSSSTSSADHESSVVRSNVNMFTRQARENGVIGGNNNVNTSAGPRRNMFDSRS